MKRAPRNKEMSDGLVKFVGTQTWAKREVCENTNLDGEYGFQN